MSIQKKELDLPTPDEQATAQEASRALAPLLKNKDARLSLVTDANRKTMVPVPPSALRLLVDILTNIGQGRPVTVVPEEIELTTQQAADMLHVSRPYVVKLVESNVLPARRVGRHRRIAFEDLMRFQQADRTRRQAALARLAELDQKLGL
jgi:excisionase family DNA binding protein